MSGHELRDKGIEIANEAVAADNAGEVDQAIAKYIKAIEYLNTASKYEKNPVTLATLKDKCLEYMERAEALKKSLVDPKAGRGAAKGSGRSGGDEEEEEDDDGDEAPPPLTEAQLKQAERDMEEELSKLIGMDSVKQSMRDLCKQLSLDIRRRQEGRGVLDTIRHMVFTGNPGVGKTTVSRLVAKLYHALGVSSKDHVVEVQKGDLVAGYVNQTATKTAKKIKEARGGILFVDEAYQLTQALQRGQSDFSGEAIDEMMKVMNDSGRKAVTFIFAGYKKEMDDFIQYNAGLESRIKYRFHFEDYQVKELERIINIKIKDKGFKMTKDAEKNLSPIIESNTTVQLRAKYNGRLTDNLLQWASDEMNTRLPLNAKGETLVTIEKADLQAAIKRFNTHTPASKADPTLVGGGEVRSLLIKWNLNEHTKSFIRAGYQQVADMIYLTEKDVRALGLTKDGDVLRAMELISGLQKAHRQMSLRHDALFLDPEARDVSEWLQKRAMPQHVSLFERHRVTLEVLGDLTYEDLKEMGVSEVGERRKLSREVQLWRDERDVKKMDAIRAKMSSRVQLGPSLDAEDVEQRIGVLRQELASTGLV